MALIPFSCYNAAKIFGKIFMNPLNEEILIGAHTSAAGGLHNALLQGKSIGANTIQLFTCNHRRWENKDLRQEEIDLWKKTLQETGFRKIMSHDSYLINLGAPDPIILEKSRNAFKAEASRCVSLGIDYLNFHPGSAIEDSVENCLDRIAESLLLMKEIIIDGPTLLVLEVTAGQGSSVGYLFEHIAHIMDKVGGKIPLGVCIDTCHIFAAGYDIRTAEGWEKTLDEFDRIVGLANLKAFHLNDSLKDLGSRVDRHAQLGEGKIGIESFQFLMTSPRTQLIPKYLETPGGPEFWEKEIKLLRSMV